MNNITGEYQTLPEEMYSLSKQQVLFNIQFNRETTDFPTLSYTSTCEIPTIYMYIPEA